MTDPDHMHHDSRYDVVKCYDRMAIVISGCAAQCYKPNDVSTVGQLKRKHQTIGSN